MTFGARSEFGRGYPEELSKLLSDHFKQEWTCLNEGVNGECSIDVLRRAFPLVRDCASLPGPKWGCLMVGTNDSKNPDYPIDLYRDNLVQMIRIFRRFHIPLLLGTLPRVKGDCMPCFDTARSNAWIDKANAAIRILAEESHQGVVDFSDMESYLVDGVHFAYAGYVEMAKRWFARVTEH